MAQLLGRMWDRVRGKMDVLRICDKVFEELADENTRLLGTSSLHVATLMVYNKINKKMIGPHKNPPCMEFVTEKMKCYRAKKIDGIPREEFHKLIMEWVSKDLRLVLMIKAVGAILATPLVIGKVKDPAEPRLKHAVEKVPTPLLFTVISVGIMFLQDVRVGKLFQ